MVSELYYLIKELLRAAEEGGGTDRSRGRVAGGGGCRSVRQRGAAEGEEKQIINNQHDNSDPNHAKPH